MTRRRFLGLSTGSIVARLLPALVVAAVLLASLLIPGRHLGTKLIASCAYVTPGPPTVTSVDPNAGGIVGGTKVVITGTNFCQNTQKVEFGPGTPAASWVLDSDTQIRAVSPAVLAPGTVDVIVTTDAGSNTPGAADHFTFVSDIPTVFTPMSPLRVFDTRFNGGKLGPGESLTWEFGGVSVPVSATAVLINTTVTNTTAASFLTVYPAGPAGTLPPTASNLNWAGGETVANLVEVKLGKGGSVTFTNAFGFAELIADLEGYFATSGGGSSGEFVSLVPSRITDTRCGSGQPNACHTLGQGQALDIQVTGVGGVPATGVQSVVVNATVTSTNTFGFLTVFPTGQTKPNASNLNWTNGGVTRANRVSVPLGACPSISTCGKITVFNALGRADVIIDVNGYFTDSTASGTIFVALAPSRITDTRNGSNQANMGKHLGPGQTLMVQVSGQGGVPIITATTPPQAVIVNVTATGPTGWSFLTIYPDATPLPTASDVNFSAGATVPNLVVVKLNTSNGIIDITNAFGTVDVIVDVVGWYG